jgi:hypothetical protein
MAGCRHIDVLAEILALNVAESILNWIKQRQRLAQLEKPS